MAIEENLPQVVITPNRNDPRHGLGKHGVVGRTLPGSAMERSTVLGKSNTKEGGETGFWGKDGFTFGDLIDLVNPLQHIPIVSSIYRAVTGDEIGIGPRLLGGAVLGGVVGFGVSAINAALEYETGKDGGNHVLMAMGLTGDKEVSVAAAKPVEGEKVLASAAPVSAAGPHSPEEALQELTEEQAAMLLLAQTGDASASLEAPSRASTDPRSLYTLGAMNSANQRYQQTQSLDSLRNVALAMDVEG